MALKEYGAIIKIKDEFTSQMQKLLKMQNKMASEMAKQQKLKEKNSKATQSNLKDISKQIKKTISDFNSLNKAGNLDLKIDARDNASDDIRQISGLINGLVDNSNVNITANANDAINDINNVNGKMSSLSGRTSNVNINANANDAITDINNVNGKMSSLSGRTTNVNINANANDAIEDINNVNSKLNTLSRTSANVNITANASDAINDINNVRSKVNKINGLSAEIDINADVSDPINDMRNVQNTFNAMEAAMEREIELEADATSIEDELSMLHYKFREAIDIAELYGRQLKEFEIDFDYSSIEGCNKAIFDLELLITKIKKISNLELSISSNIDSEIKSDLQALHEVSNASENLQSKLIELSASRFNIDVNSSSAIREIDRVQQKVQNFKGLILGLAMKQHLIKMSIQDNVSSKITKIKTKLNSIWYYSNNPIIVTARDKALPVVNKVYNRLKDMTRSRWEMLMIVKDLAMPKILQILSKVKSLTSKAFSVMITAKDMATSAISKVVSLTKTLAKGVVVPITAAVTGLGAAMKSGIDSLGQEQTQKITIQRVIENSNGGNVSKAMADTDAYYKYLENLANSTPFTNEDVSTMGTKSMMIAKGDIDQAKQITDAMANVKAFVGDMRTPQEVAEAFFSASTGNMEMINNMLGENFESMDDALKGIEERYGGLVTQMATTIPGAISTIGGKISVMYKELVKPFEPFIIGALNGVITVIDSVTEKVKIFSASLAYALGAKRVDIQGITDDGLVNSFRNIIQVAQEFGTNMSTVLQPLIDAFNNTASVVLPALGNKFLEVFSAIPTFIQPVVEVITNILTTISTRFDEFKPVLDMLSFAFSMSWTVIRDAVTIAGNIVNDILNMLANNTTSLQSIFEVFQGVATLVWDSFKHVINSAWEMVKPIFDKVIKIVGDICSIFNIDFKGATDSAASAIDILMKPLEWLTGALDKVLGLVQKVTSGISNMADSIKRNGVVGAIGELIGGRKHAYGLARVPRDGYQATLHEGETVLTKQQSNVYERLLKERSAIRKPVDMNASNVTNTNLEQSMITNNKRSTSQVPSNTIKIDKMADTIVIREEADIDKMTNSFVEKIKEAIDNYGGGATWNIG